MIRKNRTKVPQSVVPLILILISIISVFLFSRLITYLILIRESLPKFLFLNIYGFRLHHFVYGNLIIMITSFLAIGLGIRRHKNLFAVFYGIGLGLVLDEFLLWMGDTSQLNSNVMWIPYSFTAVSVVSLIIATIVMVKLYELHKFPFKLKLK